MIYRYYRAVEARLYEYGRDLKRLERKRCRLDELIAMQSNYKIPICAYSEHSGGGGRELTHPESAANAQDDAATERMKLNIEIGNLLEKNGKIEDALAELDEREMRVAVAAYFTGFKVQMRGVAEACGYSARQCWRIKDDLVRKVGNGLYER